MSSSFAQRGTRRRRAVTMATMGELKDGKHAASCPTAALSRIPRPCARVVRSLTLSIVAMRAWQPSRTSWISAGRSGRSRQRFGARFSTPSMTARYATASCCLLRRRQSPTPWQPDLARTDIALCAGRVDAGRALGGGIRREPDHQRAHQGVPLLLARIALVACHLHVTALPGDMH